MLMQKMALPVSTRGPHERHPYQMEEVSTLDLCIKFHDDTSSLKPSKSQTYFHGEELMVATPPQGRHYS